MWGLIIDYKLLGTLLIQCCIDRGSVKYLARSFGWSQSFTLDVARDR